MLVRPARAEDRDAVLAMMAALWPDGSDFAFDSDWLFVAEDDRRLSAFVYFSLRPFVDGCDSNPVPHIEGWWVEPDQRRRGIGRALIAAVENWAIARGFTELGSDTLLSNSLSRSVHLKLGFEPTEQIQYFRKQLGP